jgi:tocopherol O-methyltransferase
MITAHSAAADIAAVAAHYDDLDPFYQTVWGAHVHHGYWITGKESSGEAVLNLTHLVAKQAGIEPGVRVCDVGCGYGASALIFAQDYGARVTGITVSTKQYQQAKSAAAGRDDVDFLLCDGLHSGLSSESFESVVSIESSEHMQDKPAFFAEVNRLLRPAGRLVVAAWLTREQPRWCESKYLLEPICREGRLPNLASASEYCAMIEAAGFEDLQFADLTRSVKKTWRVCALRFISRVCRDPSLRRLLFDRDFKNRVFAKTVLRIWLAYRTGSMRYGLFSAVK